MEVNRDIIPVLSILLVIVAMAAVDIVIIGQPIRVLTVIPISLVLVLWFLATRRIEMEAEPGVH